VNRWTHSAMVVGALGIKLIMSLITYIWFLTSRTFVVDKASLQEFNSERNVVILSKKIQGGSQQLQ
jgi:hypothetical protein